MRILLAIDDSKFSEAAIEAVIEQARPEDTEVRVLHVVESPPLLVARELELIEPRRERPHERRPANRRPRRRLRRRSRRLRSQAAVPDRADSSCILDGIQALRQQ